MQKMLKTLLPMELAVVLVVLLEKLYRCFISYFKLVAHVYLYIYSSSLYVSSLFEQGVGGILELAPGYLPAVYSSIRKAGGLCIADEVQSGFARTGSHFWGFEAHGVVPDIVTMAKVVLLCLLTFYF